MYDAFISHASEDKESFVDPLVQCLRHKDYNVWYDRFCIQFGQSISATIHDGIQESNFALFVITPVLIKKPKYSWVWRELYSFICQEETLSRNILIPILYKITTRELENNLDHEIVQTLTDRRAVRTFIDGGIFGIVKNLEPILNSKRG